MAERKITGEVEFEGNAVDEITKLNDEMNDTASNLTEVEEMGSSAGAAVAEGGAEGADAMEDLAKDAEGAADALGDTEDAAGGLSSVIGGLGAAVAAAGLAAFGKEALSAAINLEEQVFRVEALSGDAFPELKAAIDATIVSQKGLRAEGDLSEAANEALKLGVSADVVTASLENVAQISSVLDLELPRVMKAIGLAIETGTESQLERLGFGVEDALGKFDFAAGKTLNSLTKMQRETVILAAVQDKANETAGSFNDFLETGAAQLQIFETQIGNLMESIGQVFIPIMNVVLGVFSDLIKFIQENETALLAFQVAVGVVAVAIGVVLLGAFIAALPPMIAFVTTMIAAIPAAIAFLSPFLVAAAPFIAVAAAIAVLVFIVDDLISFFQGGESVIGDFIEQFPLLSLPIQFIIFNIGLLISVFSFLFDKFSEVVDRFEPEITAMGEFFGSFTDGIVDKFNFIVDFISIVAKIMFQPIMEALSLLGPVFEVGLGFIKDFFPGSPVKRGPLTVLNDAGEGIIDLVQSGINDAPDLDIGVEAGVDGDEAGGGVGGTSIGRVEFVINITAPEGRFGTKDIIVRQVQEAIDELSRGPLRSQLGLS